MILEGDVGKGFSAWFPDLPGVFAAGNSQRQVEMLAKEAAEDELQECDTLPTTKFRTRQETDLLLKDMLTIEKLLPVHIQLKVPPALLHY